MVVDERLKVHSSLDRRVVGGAVGGGYFLGSFRRLKGQKSILDTEECQSFQPRRKAKDANMDSMYI
jgi:hypothetical protein